MTFSECLDLVSYAIHYIPRWEALFAFLFFAVSSVFVITRGSTNWLWKAFTTVSALFAILMFTIVISNSMGWPARQRLPKNFDFMWAEIIEPQGDYKGAIRWWVKYLDKDGEEVSQSSRIFEMKYTEELHRYTLKLLAELLSGKEVILHQKEGKDGSGMEGIPFSEDMDDMAGEGDDQDVDPNDLGDGPTNPGGDNNGESRGLKHNHKKERNDDGKGGLNPHLPTPKTNLPRLMPKLNDL